MEEYKGFSSSYWPQCRTFLKGHSRMQYPWESAWDLCYTTPSSAPASSQSCFPYPLLLAASKSIPNKPAHNHHLRVCFPGNWPTIKGKWLVPTLISRGQSKSECGPDSEIIYHSEYPGKTRVVVILIFYPMNCLPYRIVAAERQQKVMKTPTSWFKRCIKLVKTCSGTRRIIYDIKCKYLKWEVRN